MTNSPATVIAARRNNSVKIALLAGMVLLAASLPLMFFIKSGGLEQGLKSLMPGKSAESQAQKAPLAGLKSKLKNFSDQGAVRISGLELAAQNLSKEIARSPSDPALRNEMGLIYLTLGDSKSAENSFKTAVSLCRASIASYMSEFKRLQGTGKEREEQAGRLIRESSRLNVELTAAHSNLARIYDKAGKRQAVVGELEQIEKDGQLFNGFASVGATLKKGKEPSLSPQEAQSLARAEALFKSNRLLPALEEYRALSERNPRNAFVFDRIGLISVMTGDLNGAAEAWEAAAALDKDSASIAGNLGLAYQHMGLEKESEKWFKRALLLDPKMEEASLNLAALLSSNKDLAGAISVLKKAREQNPRSARVANNLGTYLFMKDNYVDALSAFHQAIRIDRNMASAHYGMGLTLMKTHKYVQAVRELKTAAALNPSLHDAHVKIEEAMKLSGNAR